MSGFLPGTVVDVQQVDDVNWQLLQGIDYQGNQQLFHIPAGNYTDFASVPRVFVWLLPRYGRYTKAAILHDYMWDVEVPRGMSRIDADGIFRQAMRELGVSFLRRWMMWAAVRWAALFKKDGRKEWFQEAHRVLGITFLCFVFAFPPLLPIVLSLLLFYIAEWILWVPLKTIQTSQRKKGKQPVKVNPPTLNWKL